MKKMLLCLAAALALVSCGTSSHMSQAQKEALAQDVAWSVDHQDMIIDITTIYPYQGPAKMSAREYSIVLHDGHIRTRLPFFGESRSSVIYGVDESSIVLEDDPIEGLVIDRSKVKRKGEYKLLFSARRRQTPYYFTLTVYDNGAADIMVNTPNKTPMHYAGELYFGSVKR